jgi:predicted nucleotidyltransferase
MDKLNLGLSWFIRYVVSGAAGLLVVAGLDSTLFGVLDAIPEKLLASEVLVVLALFLIGAPIYHLHREVFIRAHHLLLCFVFRVWESLGGVTGRDSWNPVRLLGKRFGVQVLRRFAAYREIRRDPGVFPDKERLYVLHAVNGVPVLLATALLVVFVGKLLQTGQVGTTYWFLAASLACVVIALPPAYALHRREAARMKTVNADARIRRILVEHGFTARPSWQVALDEFAGKCRQTYDGRYGRTFLYGSRARGTSDEDSDIDVLVVLNPLGDFWEVSTTMQEMAESICLEHDVLLSALPVDQREFDNPRSPLLMNARREGFTWDEH